MFVTKAIQTSFYGMYLL